ncbi:7-carboxy-7-deazaguanine synthase QueE [Streptomyces sp. NPDC005407]|uniref:7-carboxy-7-deazaguanine synthase QueE n=1 Tax=Streptomyces sp. NPDC005407 TaxID=3155340 RepID=UPI0033A03ABA
MQGEGVSSGRACAFLRLGGCNLTCRWCDTPYTWDWKGVGDAGIAYKPADELHALPEQVVVQRLLGLGVDLIVVSGGEPLNQQYRLEPVIRALHDHGIEVEIETNGTVIPSAWMVDSGVRFNVSPKLAHSGVAEHRRIVPDALTALAKVQGTAFKFVCADPADLDEIGHIVDRFSLRNIWIMPLGQTVDEIADRLRRLVDPVVARGWNLTNRMHVLIWGSERGV